MDATRLWMRILGVAVLGIAVFGLLGAMSDLKSLRAGLATFSWTLCAVAVVLSLLNYAIRYVRFEYLLLRLGQRVPRFDAILILVAGFALSITPGKVGELYKAVLLRRHDVEYQKSVPILVAERVGDLVSILLLIAIGAVLLGQINLAIFTGVVTLTVSVFATNAKLGSFALDALARVRFLSKLVAKARPWYEALTSLFTVRSFMISTALASLAWSAHVATLWVIALGFGVSLSVGDAIFAYTAPVLAGVVALVPGGLGVSELSMVALLRDVGSGVAVSITIVTRLVTLWLAVLLGAGALVVLLARRGSAAAQPNPAAPIDAAPTEGGL